MARWTVTNSEKKQCIESTVWVRSDDRDRKIVREVGWRWGTYWTDSVEKPSIEIEDNCWVASDADDWDLGELTDGSGSEWMFPEDMEEDEREEIQSAYDENDDEGLEDLGWTIWDGEVRLFGPFSLVNEDTGEEFEDFMSPQ